MAHGSKRWIIAFDGTLKRSNDKTRKDYYRGLKYWEPYNSRFTWRKNKGEFCPQCKHNFKALEQEAEDAGWRYFYRVVEERWLCPKHLRYNEKKDEMWARWHHGWREHSEWQWARRQNYRKYRAECRDLMKQERYEDLLPYKHEWLD